MLVSNIKSEFTFKDLKFRYKETSENLEYSPDKLVAMVTPDNLGNQK